MNCIIDTESSSNVMYYVICNGKENFGPCSIFQVKAQMLSNENLMSYIRRFEIIFSC